jgi:hypothetical protein
MSAQFSVRPGARRAFLKAAAASMALVPAASAFARVAPEPTHEPPNAPDSSGYRMTPHIERYYNSALSLHK